MKIGGSVRERHISTWVTSNSLKSLIWKITTLIIVPAPLLRVNMIAKIFQVAVKKIIG